MSKVCHFEIPGLPGDSLYMNKGNGLQSKALCGIPSTYCDTHLKELYFNGTDEQGLGTILIGINFISDSKKEKT